MHWKVIKLGGTSQCITGYNNLIEEIKNSSDKIIVVLSAVKGVTNLLEKFTDTNEYKYIEDVKSLNKKLYDELIKDNNFDELFNNIVNVKYCNGDCDIYERSRIIGMGEVLSTNIFYNYIRKTINVQLLNCYNFIKSKEETFELYQSVEFEGDIDKFNEMYDNSKVVVCQGFIASTQTNKTILLGRGGSDTTGSIIANMLNAYEYQNWTDVDGIYYVDPKTC